jgi:hypothetical protein
MGPGADHIGQRPVPLRHTPEALASVLRKYEIDRRRGTSHTAQLVYELEIGMMKNSDLGLVFNDTTIDGEFIDKLDDLPDKQLATVNKGNGIADIHAVQLQQGQACEGFD